MNLCKDCRHCKPSPDLGLSHSVCAVAPRTDPVSGAETFGFCSIERGNHDEGACGPDGAKFLPAKETLDA